MYQLYLKKCKRWWGLLFYTKVKLKLMNPWTNSSKNNSEIVLSSKYSRLFIIISFKCRDCNFSNTFTSLAILAHNVACLVDYPFRFTFLSRLQPHKRFLFPHYNCFLWSTINLKYISKAKKNLSWTKKVVRASG